MRNRQMRTIFGLVGALALLVATGCERTAEMAPRGTERSTKTERNAKTERREKRIPDRLVERQPQSEAIAVMEQETLRRINRVRKEHGLEPLKSNETLTHLARAFSRLMAEKNFFAHEAPSGETLVDRTRQAGVEYWRIGENIFKSVNVSNPERQAVEAWMKSTGHRKNILNEEYTTTGVGIWKDGKTYYFTQEFARLR